MPQFQPVRGMNDYLPDEANKLRYVEQKTRETAQLYGYDEVITPLVESYELLATKAGNEMRHRMYTFNDMAGRKIALRGEFTPSIARLVATKMRTLPKPLKLFCTGSLYRYDEPQYGRNREFWQANYELMGTSHPEADAEIITLTSHLLNSIGLSNHQLKIGHMGILRGLLNQEGIQETQQNQIMQLLDKKQWDQALTTAQNLKASRLCLKTLKTLIQTKGNDTTNILDQIDEAVKNYETAGTAAQNLHEIIALIKDSSMKAEILIEAGFARGLEYYTGMIFEAYAPELEKTELAIGGGGRYDKLIELFGGEPTPAVGVALGIDRITLAITKAKTPQDRLTKKHAIVIPLDKDMLTQANAIASTLRQRGIPTEIELMRRPFSKALSDADRRGLQYAVLIGPEEAKQDKVTLRNMKNREQRTIEKEKLITEIMKGK